MNAPTAGSPQHLSEAQGREWKDEKTIAARRRWKPKLDLFYRPATAVILQAAQVRPGIKVLDVASGMGEPALALAEAVGPTGHVTATDFAPGVLEVAEEDARARGLANIAFRQADAQELPFPDQSFDLVTCRLGVMFFPDTDKALREAHRVLKPGGRAIYVAWGPKDQPLFKSTVGILTRYSQAPPRDKGAPDPFKFSTPGALSRAMERAGFAQAREETRTILLVWAGSPGEYWERFSESAAPFRALIEGIPDDRRAQAFRETLEAIGEHYDGKELEFVGVIVVGTGIHT